MHPVPSDRVISVLRPAVAVVLLAEALVIALVHATRDPVAFPVMADLGGSRVELARVDVAAAAVVLLVLVGGIRLLPILLSRSATSESIWSGRTTRLVEYSISSSVLVFLVALLNGLAEVATLVLAYAITSGMTLFTIVQGRARVTDGHPMLPMCFGAAVGIVPWGVIAFSQVGGGIVGTGPSLLVRVITLAMLGFAVAFFVTQWRESRRLVDRKPGGGERMHVLLGAASTSVFAWLALYVVLPTG